jgi:hypothetical protein
MYLVNPSAPSGCFFVPFSRKGDFWTSEYASRPLCGSQEPELQKKPAQTISIAGFTARSLISLGDHVGMSIHRINSMRIMCLIGIWQNTDYAMTVKKMRI